MSYRELFPEYFRIDRRHIWCCSQLLNIFPVNAAYDTVKRPMYILIRQYSPLNEILNLKTYMNIYMRVLKYTSNES